MTVRLSLLLTILVAAGCGGEEPIGPAPAPAAPPPPAATPFGIVVPATSSPGGRPALRLQGEREGVTIRILKVAEPVPLLLDQNAPDPDDAELVSEFAAGKRPPRLEAGLYLVTTRGAPRDSRARLLVTDLALVAKRSRDEILVFAADAGSGLPVPDARITMKRDGIVEGDVADARGVFRRRLPPGPLQVVVAAGDRLAVVSCPAAPAADDPTPFVLFDRPAYRPGETLRFKSLVGPDEVRLEDRRGVKLAPDRLTRASSGSAWGSFRLPRAFAPGTARLTIATGGGLGELPVPVIPDRRPTFGLTVIPEARVVARGRPVGFWIQADAADGSDLSRAAVRYRVERLSPAAAEPVLEGRGALDAFGELAGSFVPEGAGEYRIRAELPGPGSEAAADFADVAVLPASVALDLDTSRRFFLEGETPFARVRASFPLAGRVPVAGTVRVAGRELPFEIPGAGEPVAEVDLGPLEPGPHRVTAAATDPDGRPCAAELRLLAGADRHESEDILLVPDRVAYSPGARMRALVLLPPGFEGATLLATVEGQGLGNHQIVTAAGRKASLRFEAPREPGRRAAIRVIAFRAGTVLEAGAEVRVSSRQERLTVLLRAEPPEPRPGEPFEIEIGAEGVDGEWVSAPACLLVRSGGGRRVPDVADLRFGDRPLAVTTATFPEGSTSGAEAGETPRAVEPPRAAGVVVAEWSPHVFLPGTPRTAKVPVVLPSGPTIFEATAVAAIGDRAGSGTLTIRAGMPHRLRIRAPPFLTVGDVAPVEALLVNRTDSPLSGAFTFDTEGLVVARGSGSEVKVERGGRILRTLPLAPAGVEPFRLAAAFAGPGLVKGRSLPVHPAGVERRRRAAGTLSVGRTLVSLDLPPGVSPRDARIEVELRLGTAGALAAGRKPAEMGQPAASLALLARDLLERREENGGSRSEPEDPITRYAELWAHQGADGAFSRWPDGPADPRLTAVVVTLAALARKAGMELDEARVDRARAFIAGGSPVPELPGEEAVRAALALAGSGREWGPADLGIRQTLLHADIRGPARFLVPSALAAAPALGTEEEAAIRVRAGNGIAASVRLDGEYPAAAVSIPPGLLVAGRNSIVFESSGSPHVAYRALLAYRVPGGAEGSALPFSIRRALRRADPEGTATTTLGAAATVPIGEYLRADVAVAARVPERWVTVECPLPGGARAVTGVLPVPEGVRTEVRDDRIVFRLPRLGEETVVLPVLLRASHPGRFTLRPAEVWSEDDPDRRADAASASVRIH